MRWWPIEEGAIPMTPQSKAGKAQPPVRATASPRLHRAAPAPVGSPGRVSPSSPRSQRPILRLPSSSSLLPPLPLSHRVLALRYLTTLLLPGPSLISRNKPPRFGGTRIVHFRHKQILHHGTPYLSSCAPAPRRRRWSTRTLTPGWLAPLPAF